MHRAKQRMSISSLPETGNIYLHFVFEPDNRYSAPSGSGLPSAQRPSPALPSTAESLIHAHFGLLRRVACGASPAHEALVRAEMKLSRFWRRRLALVARLSEGSVVNRRKGWRRAFCYLSALICSSLTVTTQSEASPPTDTLVSPLCG